MAIVGLYLRVPAANGVKSGPRSQSHLCRPQFCDPTQQPAALTDASHSVSTSRNEDSALRVPTAPWGWSMTCKTPIRPIHCHVPHP